jgi:hypothetical protein
MSSRARTIAYWATTGLFSVGMLGGGTGQLLRARFNVDGAIHLGYPLYVLTLIGLWKFAGVAVLLAPRLPLMKEWAYAGFFFLLTGATASHLASLDGLAGSAGPIFCTCLAVASWWLRPAERRLRASVPKSDAVRASGDPSASHAPGGSGYLA